MPRFIIRLIALYVILLAVFVGALYNANRIPYSRVADNIVSSHSTLDAEGYNRQVVDGVFVTMLDNYTDAWMLGLCHPDSTVSAFDNIFRDTYHNVDTGNNHIHPIPSLLIGTDRSPSPVVVWDYTRYWHGYLSTLRPVLTVLDYARIRILNYVLLSSLAVLALTLTYLRRGALCFWALLVTLLAGTFPIVPLSLQFSTCFYIALVSLSLLLMFPSLTRGAQSGFLTFFTIGAVTVYMDFLTIPLVTLGLPAAIVLYRRSHSLRLSVIWSLAWFSGYALLWATKWALVILIMGTGYWHDIIISIVNRSTGDVPVRNLIEIICNSYTVAAALAVAMGAVMALAYARCRRGRMRLFHDTAYLCILCVPVVLWFVVLHNQVTMHFSYTWRVLMVPVLCGILYMWTVFFQKDRKTAELPTK